MVGSTWVGIWFLTMRRMSGRLGPMKAQTLFDVDDLPSFQY